MQAYFISDIEKSLRDNIIAELNESAFAEIMEWYREKKGFFVPPFGEKGSSAESDGGARFRVVGVETPKIT